VPRAGVIECIRAGDGSCFEACAGIVMNKLPRRAGKARKHDLTIVEGYNHEMCLNNQTVPDRSFSIY
jgi:hypothetical protein